MSTNYQRWRMLFLWCLGLFLGTAFCMKWMESEFVYGGKLFTIIGLEATCPMEQVKEILTGLNQPGNEHTRYLLHSHLCFDFAFMAGVYPGIAALCMMGRLKAARGQWRKWLGLLAGLQAVAWGCDIAENMYLLSWMKDPSAISGFGTYHIVVYVKWALALAGALMGIIFSLKRKRAIETN